jgi:putative glycosyltransferase (TIGR04372 family)
MLAEKFVKAYKKIIFKKVKEKGWFYVLRKSVSRLFTVNALIIYPIIFFFCLIIKLIKPIVFIRFGALNTDRFGLLAAIPELNLCEQEAGIQPSKNKTINIYNNGHTSFVSNSKLLDMWSRVIRIYPKSRYFWNIMNAFSFGKNHIIETTFHTRDVHGLLENTKSHLVFSKIEIQNGKEQLLTMGISEQDKYVLMINRGDKFLKEGYIPTKNIDFSYHSYRNSNIKDYLPMAEMLTAKGNFVIRMGHLVSDFMETKNPKIIEYDEGGHRTELLDIYLAAHCRYIIGSDTGYLAMPGWVFRKPIVFVNFSQLNFIEPFLSSWIIIFKKYWLKKESRFLKINEILESGVGKFNRTEEFQQKGIEVINNTPEEILDATDEMEKRLNGKWKDSIDDEKLQKKFWSYFESKNNPGFFKPKYNSGIIRGRIGSRFLRNVQELL